MTTQAQQGRPIIAIMRKVCADGSYIVFFPCVLWARDTGTVASYSHVGQHSGASRAYYDTATKRADSSPEAQALFKEVNALYNSEEQKVVWRVQWHASYVPE